MPQFDLAHILSPSLKLKPKVVGVYTATVLLLSQHLPLAAVPDNYFEGVLFEDHLPSKLETGKWISLKGTVEDESIFEILFDFRPNRGEQSLSFRVLVVRGRFEQTIVFDHDQAGGYLLELWFSSPTDFTRSRHRVLDIDVAESAGDFELPPEMVFGLSDRARFEPNVITTDDTFLPPLFVRGGGQTRTVNAFVTGVDGRERAFDFRDDGIDPDARSGDGIFSLSGVPWRAGELPMGDIGNAGVWCQIIDDNNGVDWAFAEFGIVDGSGLASPTRVADDAYRSAHILNIVNPLLLNPTREMGVDVHRTTNRFYELLPDDYDFLVIRPSFSLDNGIYGLNLDVRNGIRGIGRDEMDDGHLFGSHDRLKSALFVNFVLVGPLVHEIAHTWANSLDLFEANMWGAHWGASDVEGVLGGYATEMGKMEDGNYAVSVGSLNSFWGGRYADLELYLMGLIPADEVTPHTVIRKPNIIEFPDSAEGSYIISGTLDTVTVQDIIAAAGPREPDFAESQKDFSLATVVVSPEPLSSTALTYYDRQMDFFGSEKDDPLAFAAATGFRATMDTRIAPTATAVGEEHGRSLPEIADLAQNFPNPFNADTTIRFHLTQSEEVELTVHNLAGQKVVTLLHGPMEVGTHTLRWDGRDDDGRELATGVYLYRLQFLEGATETRKMALVR